MNSLRGGTGNQFDRNRERDFRKQGINSRHNRELGIGTEKWLDSYPLAPRKRFGDAQ